MDDMGIFRTTIEIQNLDLRKPPRTIPETMVDTGSEFTWIPRRVLEELGIRVQRRQAFEVADGRRIEREIGYALVRAGGTEAPDLVVFGEPGDMTLLGAHSLEGLNLKIDPIRKELVPAGPVITAPSRGAPWTPPLFCYEEPRMSSWRSARHARGAKEPLLGALDRTPEDC